MSTIPLIARGEKTVKDDLLPVSREKEYLRQVQEGIDLNEYVEHEAVDRWLASWGTENELAPPIPITK